MVNLILPPLYILFFCLPFYGLTTKPSSFRPLLILPIASIALYLARFTTTSSPLHDYLLGTLICGNLFSSSDFILLTDVQNELRLVGQNDPISGSSLSERLRWAFKLFIGVRGVGWAHEPTYALRPRKKHLSRWTFVTIQTVNLVGYVYLLRFLEAYQDINTYLPNSTPKSLLEALRLPLVAYIMAYSHISLSHLLVSVLSVATGTTNPQDWPHLFGALSDAYTVRQFWGRTWHQLLRRMVSSHGKYLAHRVLHLTKGSMASSYVQLYTAFFVSGIIHYTGDYMVSHQWQGQSLHFFLLQAVAITIEDGVIGFGKMLGIRGSGDAWKALGFAWCWLWFAYSLPIWLTPIFEAVVLRDRPQLYQD